MRLPDRLNGWRNIYPELIMVDNSNIPFELLSLLWQHVKCAAKHVDKELYVAKEKIQNHMIAFEHKSIKQVLADPLTKGLPPKSTWVLRDVYDFWITKGPRKD